MSLQTLISDTKSKVSKEANYTQATFAKFLNAYNAAIAIKSTDSATKIENALENLKSANSGLKTASTAKEKEIVAKKAELRVLVENTAANIVSNKSKYTSVTYSKFNTELGDAKKVLADTDATLDEIKYAYNDLDSAISKLELVTNTPTFKEAVEELDKALASVSKVESKDSYTEASYKKYETALNNANTIKKNIASKTETEIKNAAKNLNDAIDGLEFAIETLRAELNQLMVDNFNKTNNSSDYMEETFEDFMDAFEYAQNNNKSTEISIIKKALNDLKEAISNLKTIEEELTKTVKAVEKMKKAEHVKDALESDEQTSEAKKTKISNIKKAAKLDLEELIAEANEMVSDDTTGELTGALYDAKKVNNNSKSTLEEIAEQYSILNPLVHKS